MVLPDFGVGLAAVVGDGRQISDVIQVRMADDARVQAELRLQIHTARERARVDRESLIDHESAGAVTRRLSAVTTYDAKFHDFRVSERRRLCEGAFTLGSAARSRMIQEP